MDYLLLMYHPENYWTTRTDQRDEAEEEAFGEFCAWMREKGITWRSHALEAPKAAQSRKFSADDVTTRLLPELTDVISGYFELSIPDENLLDQLLERCPHIGGTGLELRAIAD